MYVKVRCGFKETKYGATDILLTPEKKASETIDALVRLRLAVMAKVERTGPEPAKIPGPPMCVNV
jgi:hypothetical protein